jgi:anti-sigma factor (TIGR02949 family)
MTLFDRLRRLFGAGQNGDQRAPEGSQGISCEEALRLVHEFIDGELEDVTYAEVQAHFEMCKVCYPHLHLERRFREALQRACAQEKASPELRQRVLQMVSGDAADA